MIQIFFLLDLRWRFKILPATLIQHRCDPFMHQNKRQVRGFSFKKNTGSVTRRSFKGHPEMSFYYSFKWTSWHDLYAHQLSKTNDVTFFLMFKKISLRSFTFYNFWWCYNNYKMRSRRPSSVQLDSYYRIIYKTILCHQDATTGLLPGDSSM